jgi:hypothetical protein
MSRRAPPHRRSAKNAGASADVGPRRRSVLWKSALIRGDLAEIYTTISNGKIDRVENRPRMPAWRGKLSSEMIWALIYFIEYQSGGIEGRFPPSLYPKSERVEGQ